MHPDVAINDELSVNTSATDGWWFDSALRTVAEFLGKTQGVESARALGVVAWDRGVRQDVILGVCGNGQCGPMIFNSSTAAFGAYDL